jgi:hypothetical protein
MNQVTTTPLAAMAGLPASNPRAKASLLAERVREMAASLGCKELWARGAGRHVILGRGEDEAFARITPLGAGAYGLTFRAPCEAAATPAASGRAEPAASSLEASAALVPSSASRWAPLLLIDALADVVEHALIGEGAIYRRMPCM